jgi:hypothetical protein
VPIAAAGSLAAAVPGSTSIGAIQPAARVLAGATTHAVTAVATNPLLQRTDRFPSPVGLGRRYRRSSADATRRARWRTAKNLP